jgi:ABC-type glycerol-3-phosphate transport system substrate-binding protein
VAVIPTFKGYETATSSGSWWIAIPRGAKNVEAAWEFMKFAVKKEYSAQRIILTAGNSFPGK